MEQFFVILQQLFIFTVFILTGILCVKVKVLDEIALNYISKFIITISMPVMLLCNLLTGPSFSDLVTSLPIFVIYLISFLILYLFNSILSRFFNFDFKKRSVFKAISTFSNAGFIGIPLILSVFGQEGAIYMSLCMIIDQVMLWTLGVKLTSGIEKINLENIKKLINPALITIFIAIICLLFNLKLPKILTLALDPIGKLTTPLSLIYIGGLFCYCDIKKFLHEKDIYSIVIFKMLAFSGLLYCGLKYLPISCNMSKTVVLLMSLPPMTSIALFTKKYNNYNDYAVSAILITTMYSIITLPLISLLISYF